MNKARVRQREEQKDGMKNGETKKILRTKKASRTKKNGAWLAHGKRNIALAARWLPTEVWTPVCSDGGTIFCIHVH